MAHKNGSGNNIETMSNAFPGIGPKDAIEDCSIGVQGDPGVVTVTFSHMSGEKLLVLDPGYAEILAGWLTEMARRANVGPFGEVA